MSSEAKLETGEVVHLTATGDLLNKDGVLITGFHTFHCITCNCEMTLAAQHSTYKKAYFTGKHVPGMGCGKTHASKGITRYHITQESIDDLFASVCTTENKAAVETREYNRTGVGHRSRNLEIHTFRQFYKALKASNIYDPIYPGAETRVCDYFCGEETKHIYTTYISGRHVVEAEFHRYDSEELTINFWFPSAKNHQLNFAAIFENSMEFHRALNYIFSKESKKFVIFADFEDGTCQIHSSKQIIRQS